MLSWPSDFRLRGPMNKHIFGISTLLLSLAAASLLNAQGDRPLRGRWHGTRSERNPINGQTFTIDFAFEFKSDGTYVQEARLGRLTILKLKGGYTLQRGRKAGDPSYTHILSLRPGNVAVEPGRDELRLLQIAALPNVDPTDQYLFFYNLAPAGALTLQDRSGGESWGLQRVP